MDLSEITVTMNFTYVYVILVWVNDTKLFTGTHVAIKGPTQDEELYYNRKRFHSLNVQAVCNAAGLIISYSARFPGCYH